MMRLSCFKEPVVLSVFLLLSIVSMTTCQGRGSDELTDAVQAAVAKADSAVVRIRVLGSARALQSEGSATVTTGIAISKDGSILTSAFALQGKPQAILVEDQQGNASPAKIVATDFLRKLVLLKASGRFTPATIKPLDEIAPGQWSIAVGRFFSSNDSNVSVGIVSALNRIHGLAIQTDAKISPVNYGGPLIDLEGRAMGVLVPLSPGGRDDPGAGVEWYDSGIGFAIPMQAALDSARRMQEEGDLFPGKLGISVDTGSPWSSPVTIREVATGGPADRVGIQKGDEIVSANGRPMTRNGIFESVVARTYAGEILNLDIRREQMNLSFQVPLTDRLIQPGYGLLGLLPLGSADIENQPQGVAVAVLPQSPADAAGLTGPFLLQAIDGRQVESLPDLYTAVNSLVAGADITIEYRTSMEAEPQSTELTAAALPQTIPWQNELELSSLLRRDEDDQSSAAALDRSELELGPAGKCVIFRVPVEQDAVDARPMLPGVVVLCSESGSDEADIVRKWEPIIRDYQLQVVLPRNAEGGPLSVTDARMIRQALVTMRQSTPYDPLRVIAAARSGQTALAASLALTPRSPVRAAAFLEGWFAPEAGLELGRTRRALFYMDQPADAQSAALHDQAVGLMDETGARVFRINPDQRPSESSQLRAVGDWSLLLKAI